LQIRFARYGRIGDQGTSMDISIPGSFIIVCVTGAAAASLFRRPSLLVALSGLTFLLALLLLDASILFAYALTAVLQISYLAALMVAYAVQRQCQRARERVQAIDPCQKPKIQ
jgi:hypothetical protein